MESKLFQEVAKSKRSQVIKDNCDAVEMIAWAKPFETNEIEQKKSELSEVMIRLLRLEEELCEIKSEYKKLMKSEKKKVDELLQDIKFGSRMVTEECYKFVDYDEKIVGYYNGEGILVKTRPVLPGEEQKTIFRIEKTGTEE